jgi:hypothetical protein
MFQVSTRAPTAALPSETKNISKCTSLRRRRLPFEKNDSHEDTSNGQAYLYSLSFPSFYLFI